MCPDIAGFDPIAYSVTEGVDGSVTLRVVRTGSAAIPVTVTVTTVSGTAESVQLLRCYYIPFMCDWFTLFQQME